MTRPETPSEVREISVALRYRDLRDGDVIAGD